MRDLKEILIGSVKIFLKKRAHHLGAASTFYFFLALVPIVLLSLQLLGPLFKLFQKEEIALNTVIENLFEQLYLVYPDIPRDLFVFFEKHLGELLSGGFSVSFLDFFILSFSALGLLNTLGGGVGDISEIKGRGIREKLLDGPFFFGLSLIILLVLFIAPYLIDSLLGLASWVEGSVFEIAIKNATPALYKFLISINGGLQSLLAKTQSILKNGPFQFLCLLIYMSFVYWWFFKRKVPFVYAVIASASFSLLVVFSKFGLSVYLSLIREGLNRNFGGPAGIVVGILWIYLIFVFFYYGACVLRSINERG